jgi:two-component system chemotaxis sensor kinase CheA
MTGMDQGFHERLLGIFAGEAADHLVTITRGLLSLEKSGVATGEPGLVEGIYRETHSLKGAARAVGLREIEGVCQGLEAVFSAMKKDEYLPDQRGFDAIHATIDLLSALLSGKASFGSGSPNPAEMVQVLRGLLPRKGEGVPVPHREVSISVRPYQGDEGGSLPPVGPSVQPAPFPSPPLPTGADSPPPMAMPGEPRMVRVMAEKLDRLHADADDLLAARISLGARLEEMKGILARIEEWRMRAAQSGRMNEFLAYNKEFIGRLHRDFELLVDAVVRDSDTLEMSVGTLAEGIRDVVLQPVATLFEMVPRAVRDLSHTFGKTVEVVLTGGEIEADRRVLEAVRDPLIHLVRNAIDHGIEAPAVRVASGKPPYGTIQITAALHEGGMITLSIADDGGGIDLASVRRVALELGFLAPGDSSLQTDADVIPLIFRSGLSTSSIITTISGRGIGLAIVYEKVAALGGTVVADTEPGRSTVFHLSLPVSLSTFRGLLVAAGVHRAVIPLQAVSRVFLTSRSRIATVENRMVVEDGGATLPLITLAGVLGVTDRAKDSRQTAGEMMPVVVITAGGERAAFLVDEVLGDQEVVVRGLGPQLKWLSRVSGATVLGDGKVALVLKPDGLINEGIRIGQGGRDGNASQEETAAPLLRVLVVEDSVTSRVLLKNIIEGAGFIVDTAVDGIDAFTLLKEKAFDLVVSDVDMPRMNGFSLTEKIRADPGLEDLPVVLVTSLDSREDREHGIAAGANAYIVKSSFDEGNLLEVIQRLV